MDGIYFEQGIEAARRAQSESDCAKMRPYPPQSSKGQVWTNGFLWELHKITTAYQRAVAKKG